ncbi:glucose/arabinose dehydrogenase [Sediminihabitans luteus]|uniref:Glucose/arabinose dehydrogenase n=1 Tax=Sediminihabitans luteus TaxID=1138585 RepID=A0A2M9CD40_9CELL|nr:PQQ-dependent sugar dehydrogenase [Sediminihabitans luteus]PJJ69844.1 glucose/arabinose dehydrogenase [Sediminihabitans luteus]GIJ00628.1 oxidoreductase [Sediminihabitans luteus]
MALSTPSAPRGPAAMTLRATTPVATAPAATTFVATRLVATRLVATALGVLLLAGCTDAPEGGAGRAATPVVSSEPGSGTPGGEARVTVETVATGLDVPWALAPLEDGRLVISQRPGTLVVVDPDDGSVTSVVGEGADQLADETRPEGEAGLLGIALAPASDTGHELFLYRTGDDANAVLRGRLDVSDVPTLGPLTSVLDGIPKAANHDGGRLAFGPDGHLYVTTGDAARPDRAQDDASLAGKILRVTTDGAPAPGNPDPGSPVWSLGHRNPQGIGWTPGPDPVMVAAEFGQNTWDELNVIEPGENYGWPEVEGVGDRSGFVDPIVTWSTDEASPSGLAVSDDAVYVASLRGERLWRVAWSDDGGFVVGTPQPLLTGEHGRLRAVAVDATDPTDRTLWVLTNNTDGRGDPAPDDDRLLRVVVDGGAR